MGSSAPAVLVLAVRTAPHWLSPPTSHQLAGVGSRAALGVCLGSPIFSLLGSWQVSLSPLGALAHCLLASGCADARMASVLPVPGEGPQASGACIPQTWRLLSCHCCTSSALPFHPASSEALMPVGSFNLFPHFSLTYLPLLWFVTESFLGNFPFCPRVFSVEVPILHVCHQVLVGAGAACWLLSLQGPKTRRCRLTDGPAPGWAVFPSLWEGSFSSPLGVAAMECLHV